MGFSHGTLHDRHSVFARGLAPSAALATETPLTFSARL